MNTTIGCVVTTARLTKPDAWRAADLAHNGIVRAVEPPHTDADGDAIFLLATGKVDASVDLVIQLATQAVSSAIRNAVRHAHATPGRPRDPRTGDCRHTED
jgi:L-aminopeptidase/D-esterase-like protein